MIKFSVETQHPVAIDSPDHLHPHGTTHDNHTNPAFNKKLLSLLGDRHWLSVLDLGCAGGGMVKSFIDMGVPAVGIEGSNHSYLMKRAEWATIPDYLFTADITKPFQVRFGRGCAQFTVITLWEVLEHIREANLPDVLTNVRCHLAPDGLIIATISHISDRVRGVEMHQTIRPREWWMDFFGYRGFHEARYGFKSSELVRDCAGSSLFVLHRDWL